MVLLSEGGFLLRIIHMTYALVKQGIEVPLPRMQPIKEVSGFLGDHVRKLLENIHASDAAPAGRFINPLHQRPFRRLHSGTAEDFLESYHQLAQDLVGSMTNATALGLLVALRVDTETDGIVAGVLKLEVVAPNGAALHEDDTGEVRLEAVQDMLERPGNLQKSALVTSQLPDERVFCGDRLYPQSKYFPDALGIRTHPRPRAAMKSFYDAVWTVEPELAGSVATAVPTCSPGPVSCVLEELGSKIPELTSPLQAAITEQLHALPHAVFELDPSRPVKGTYKIGEITVTGPIEEIGQLVRVSQLSDNQWQLIVDSDVKPTLVRH
jgi:hypothetical protein